jgi:hypothetical protein
MMAAAAIVGTLTSMANYQMDCGRRCSMRGLGRAGLRGGLKGALTAGAIGKLTGGRAFGFGGLGKRIASFTFFRKGW